MSFSGTLKSISFPEILQFLTPSKKSGTLIMKRGDTVKKIYFKNGTVIFADSNLTEDSFENLLLSSGALKMEELQKAKKVKELTGKDMASTIVYLNFMNKEKVAEIARRFVENIVFSVFSWDDGEFIFEEGKLPDSDIMVSSLNTMNILMEGTRRIDEWTHLRNALPPDNAVLHFSETTLSQTSEIKLSAAEASVLSLIDGERCISEMKEKSSLDQLSFAKALYSLISTGIVRRAGIKDKFIKSSEELKKAIELTAAIYNLSLDITLDTIKTKMGKSGRNVIVKTFNSLKTKYRILSYITVDDKGIFDFSNFAEMCKEIPEQTRMHEISVGLSFLLQGLLNSVSGTIGGNQKTMLVEKIRESISPILRENEAVLTKYGIIEDFNRSLE